MMTSRTTQKKACWQTNMGMLFAPEEYFGGHGGGGGANWCLQIARYIHRSRQSAIKCQKQLKTVSVILSLLQGTKLILKYT